MVTMVDEIFDRQYQDGRAEINAALSRGFTELGRMIGDSFKVLHRIEWSAPWEQKSKRGRARVRAH
jgi:hypothetical protein